MEDGAEMASERAPVASPEVEGGAEERRDGGSSSCEDESDEVEGGPPSEVGDEPGAGSSVVGECGTSWRLNRSLGSM